MIIPPRCLLLAAFVWLAAPATAFCPNGCSCVNEPEHLISADCSRADLTSIPMFLNPRLKSLNLHGNQLSSLTMDELSFYPVLQQLDLSSNQILSIERGAFASLGKLEVLSVAQNLLSSLELDTFKGLVSLRRLDLSDNTITRLPTSVFVELGGLERLNVSFNELHDVSPGAFTGLGQLQQLDMHDNKLSVIPRIALHSVRSVERLSLAGNQLSHVGNESLIHLQQLRRLDLSRNNIDAVDRNAFVGLHQLTELSLRANTLYRVPSAALRVLTDLAELDLSENKLSELDTSCFDGLANLQTLSVTHCKQLKQVHMMAFSGLFRLRVLHLHSNMQLRAVHERAFEQPTELTQLVLANNNLQQLSPALLNWSHVTQLDLRGNPWLCDCDLVWLSQPDVVRHLQAEAGVSEAVCAMPMELRGERVSLLSESGALSCHSLMPSSWLHLLLFVLTLSSCAILVVILCRFHDRLCCGGKQDGKAAPDSCSSSERASSAGNLYTRSDLAAFLPQDGHCSPFYSGGSINPKLAALQHGGSNAPLLYANFTAPKQHQAGTLGAQFYSSSHTARQQHQQHQQHQQPIMYAPPTTDGSTGSSSGYMTSNSVYRQHSPPGVQQQYSPPMAQHYDSTQHVYSAIAPLGDSPRSLRSDAALLGRNGYTLVSMHDS